MATSYFPTGITRLNDIRNRCAGTRGRCGKSGRKSEPPYEQEDDRDYKEEWEKRSISSPSQNVASTMLNRFRVVQVSSTCTKIAMYTPHLRQQAGNRHHEQVQLQRHRHRLLPRRQC